MGELIKYYKDSNEWPLIKFVCSIVDLNNDGWRPFLGRVKSTGTQIISTDLHRLFVVDLELAAGEYEVLKRTAKEIVLYEYAVTDKDKFPNCDEILKRNWKAREKFTFNMGNKFCHNSIHSAYANVVRKIPERAGLNYNFFASIGDGNWNMYYLPESEEQKLIEPLFFTKTGESILAVIMPILLNRDNWEQI